MTRSLLPLSICVLSAGILASLPVRADDDRFTLRLGAIQVDGNVRFKGAIDFSGDHYSVASERLDFGDRTVPRIEGLFRFSKRNRLLFNYFRYDNDDRYILPEDVVIDEGILPAGSIGKFKARFDLGSLVYDYALMETSTASFGAQIGAAWAELMGGITASDQNIRIDSSENIDGAAPVVGLRLSTNTEDQKWGFTVQAQYLDTRWGSFRNYSGDISRANALVEYRFTKNLGIHAGYDWFRLNANRHASNNDFGLDLRFMGPTAGMTLAF